MSDANKTAIKDIVCYLIMFLIIYVFNTATPVALLTEKGMQMLGILFACIWAWPLIGLIGPSMIAILCIGYEEGFTVTTALASTIGHPLVVFMLMIVLVIQMVENEGVPKVIVNATMK